MRSQSHPLRCRFAARRGVHSSEAKLGKPKSIPPSPPFFADRRGAKNALRSLSEERALPNHPKSFVCSPSRSDPSEVSAKNGPPENVPSQVLNCTSHMHCVYHIRSESNPEQVYTGLTDNLRQRLSEHNAGKSPHRQTSPLDPRNLPRLLRTSTSVRLRTLPQNRLRHRLRTQTLAPPQADQPNNPPAQ